MDHGLDTGELTDYERQLVLGALWAFRNTMSDYLTEHGHDAVTEIELVSACDAAARKLGGDPHEAVYGPTRA